LPSWKLRLTRRWTVAANCIFPSDSH
jgi:hypothetical protein